MVNLLIIPAFILAILAIYAAAEEAVERRAGLRKSPEKVQLQREWEDYVLNEWLYGNQRADDYYAKPANRIRLWLANKIMP